MSSAKQPDRPLTEIKYLSRKKSVGKHVKLQSLAGPPSVLFDPQWTHFVS